MNAASPASRRYPWMIVALLLPVALLNYLDRQMLASMKYSVMARHPRASAPRPTGASCSASSSGSTPSSARSAATSPTASAAGSPSAAACSSGRPSPGGPATSRTYDELLVARSLMGISEAFYIPAALALIADYHAGPTRSRAVGLHQMAIYCRRDRRRLRRLRRRRPGARLALRRSTPAASFGMLYALPLVLLLRDRAAGRRRRRRPRDPSPAGSGARAARQLLVHPARPLLHAAGAGRAGSCATGCRPSSRSSSTSARARPASSATLYWQTRRHRRRDRRRLAGRPLDAAQSPRGRIYVSAIGMAMIVPAMFGVGNAGDARRRRSRS